VALAVGVDIGAASLGALVTTPSSAMAAAGIFAALTISAVADDAEDAGVDNDLVYSRGLSLFKNS
jgi:hypothetical protein